MVAYRPLRGLHSVGNRTNRFSICFIWFVNGSVPLQVVHVEASLLAIFPALILGVIGGLCGTLFTYFNLKAVRIRARHMRSKWSSFLEPCALALVYCQIVFWLPMAWGCIPLQDGGDFVRRYGKQHLSLAEWVCPNPGEYSPMATLTYSGPETVVKTLFSHQTSGLIPASCLWAYLATYFVFACYSAGTAVASGLVLPTIIIGACMGRLLGEGAGARLGTFGLDPSWVDPGLMAFVGAGAFFAGVSRLTISLTVIMLELTGSLSHLVPLMTAIMTAKWVADGFTHPLYHALLQVVLSHAPMLIDAAAGKIAPLRALRKFARTIS